MIKFENSFHKLNTDFYENVIPSKPPKPELISFNKSAVMKDRFIIISPYLFLITFVIQQ